MPMKTLAGLLLPLYCAALLALSAWLSHYPWPEAHEPPEVEVTFTAAPDFKAIKDISQRKQVFFDYLRPMISEQNRQLTQKRQQLLQLEEKIAQGGTLSGAEREALMNMADEFALEEGRPAVIIRKLLLRVNVIPEAMALAQAASESAWGTSRFARKGNNFFGQWCYKRGCGLVPARRPAGAAHEVTAFDSPYDSVKAYIRNINIHSAYQELRALRQQQVAENQPLTAHALLPGLSRYSERGQAYIDDLEAIIRFNKLETAGGE